MFENKKKCLIKSKIHINIWIYKGKQTAEIVFYTLESIQWLKIQMDGLSDSIFLVSIQWLKIPMDGLSDIMF